MCIGSMGPRRAALALVSVLLAGSAAAQPARFVMTFTDPVTLASGTFVDDEELVLAEGPGQVRLLLADQTLSLYFGDRNGDGLLDKLNDIDALELLPVAPGEPFTAGMLFSLTSDQAGFKDGDVLRFDPAAAGGVSVWMSEADFVTATGINDGNLDVDAIALMSDGGLLFSLAEDETVGPTNVVVQDEAVWHLAPGVAQATVAYTPLQLETAVQNALGTSVAIGDVKGIEWDGGELLFTVQSPTSNDSTVFSTAGGGSVFAGFDEATLGLPANAEVDGLALLPGAPFPALRLDVAQAPTGNPVTLMAEGLSPGQPYFLLAATAPALQGTLEAGGFGALALPLADPLFQTFVINAPLLGTVADAVGAGNYLGTAPGPASLVIDLVVQVFDPTTFRVSGPVALELNQ